MLRQRRLRSQADLVWTTASASMPGHTPQARARGASVRENRWRAAMLAGFSLVLHGALTAFAMFLVVPSLPVEDMPLAMELAFEAPASPTGSAMPENAATGLAEPAEAEQPRPAPAVSKAAPEQPVPDVPPSATQPFSPKPDVPLPAPAVTPEPVPSSPVQTSQPVPEQPRPAAPLAAATSLKPPMPVHRPAPRPVPIQRFVPQERAPSPTASEQPRFPPSSASSSIQNAPQASAVFPPTAAVSPATASALPSGAWRGAFAAWVQSRKRYPDEARRQGTEGIVGVRFTVARDGQVLDAQVVQGSGSTLLDQAALAMFRGARAPQFPADMAQQQVSITVAVRYRFAE